MPSMMAIVSKAVFEKVARGKTVGDVWSTDRYASANKALAQLAGGDLYLVTVRPPNDALWLVGVLRNPTFDATQWIAAANTLAIRDISQLKRTLRFANGQGLPDKPGALGMSLQTPRVLTADDLVLLAGEDDEHRKTDEEPKPSAAKPSAAKPSAAKPSAAKPSAVKPSRPSAAKPSAGPAYSTATGPSSSRAAESSAKAGPSLSKAAKPSSSKAGPARGDQLVAQAIEQLHAGNAASALGALVGAWESFPSARLASVIDALSAETRTPAPPNLRGKTAAARTAWNEHAQDAGAIDMPMLLDAFVDVTSGDAIDRLAMIESWMPDPRVDATFVTVLAAVPYRATSTQKFWRRLFPLMREMLDPRQLARVKAIKFDGVAATMAEWLVEQRDKLLAAIEPRLSADGPDPAAIADLETLVERTRASGASERVGIEDLYRAVYASPSDDGPRTVLADALIEREDPRGEFITIQLQGDSRDRATRARERELFDAHGKQWLGELAPVVMAGFTFERGFLASCKVDNDARDRVQKLVGNPAWATVHTIEGSAAIALDPVMRSLRDLTFSQHGARGEQLPNAWRDLLIETERPLEALRYEHFYRERQWLDTVEGRRQVEVSDSGEVDALCAAVALPKLRALTLRDSPVLYVGKLVKAPVLERLSRLGFVYDRNNRFDAQRSSPLVDFTQLLKDARVPVLHFEIGSFHETLLELERGDKGYHIARMTLGPTMRSNWSYQLVDEAMRMLDSLHALGALRGLQVTTRKWTETQQVARLRAAATQMKLDVEITERA